MRKLLLLLSVITLIVAFAVPAIADVSFYGNGRMQTFFRDQSKEWTGTGYSDDDLDWTMLTTTARLGIDFKNDTTAGKVEIRPFNGSYYRHWYGTWNFGRGTLLVGQTWTPTTFFTAGQCCDDTGLGGWGGFPGARKPMIRLSFGGLKVGLVQPNAGAGFGTYVADTDVGMPKIEVAYRRMFGAIMVEGGFGMNSYDAVDATDQTLGIDSMIYGVNASIPVGAAKIAASFYMGTNLGTYGDFGANVARNPVVTGTTVDDTEETGIVIDVSYKVNPMMTARLGYGMLESDNDTWAQEDDASSYYVQLDYQPAKGVHIIPEIGMFDKGENGAKVKEGDETYFGAKWQINF
jgi:hypothetical protein